MTLQAELQAAIKTKVALTNLDGVGYVPSGWSKFEIGKMPTNIHNNIYSAPNDAGDVTPAFGLVLSTIHDVTAQK